MIIDVLWKLLQNLEPPSDLAPAFFLFFLDGFFSDGFDLDFESSLTVFGGFFVFLEAALGLSESSKHVYKHYYHFYFEF